MKSFTIHRRFAGFLTLALLVLGLDATAASVNLTGIAQQRSKPCALLEISIDRRPVVSPILSPGERVEGIEVTAIDEKSGKVVIKNGGKEETLLLGSDEAPAGRTLNFKEASSLQLLDIYQDLRGVTVIRAPSAPVFKLTLKSDGVLSRAEAAARLEVAFKEQGMFIASPSPKFAIATTFSQKARAENLPAPPPAPAADGKTEKSEHFPPGLLRFQDTDDRQVLEVYSELSGRMVLRSPLVNSTKVSVRSQTELTGAEAQWLLEAALAMGGIAMTPEGEKFVYVLPLSRTVSPPKLPANPLVAGAKGGPLAAGALKFDQANGSQVLALYAELIGRQPVKTDVPEVRMSMRSQMQLTRSEALYAMDAMAALNQLRFVAAGEDQVKLEPIPPDRKDAAAPPL